MGLNFPDNTPEKMRLVAEAAATLRQVKQQLRALLPEPARAAAGECPGSPEWKDLLAQFNATERLLATEILRDSEERYRLLFESNPEPMWVYDAETLRFLAVNNAAIAKYGYAREAFLAMTIRDIRPPEDVPALQNVLAQMAQQNGISHHGVWRHRTRDGRIILVEISTQALDFAGRRAHLTLALDVTERLEVEREIERQASFVRFNPNPVMELTPAGEVNYINDAAKSMARKLGQQDSQKILPPDIAAVVGECLTRNQPRLRLEVQLADHVIAWSFFPIASLKVVHGYAADVTEIKRYEEALRASEALLRNAQRIAHLGHWELNLKTGRLDWSDEVYEIFGVSRDQFGASYEAFMACVHPEDRGLMQRGHEATRDDSQPMDLVHRIVRPDGTVRWVRELGETTLDSHGRPVRLSGTVSDITETKEAELRIRETAALLANAQRIGNMGSWEYDVIADRLVWSDETYRIFGTTPEKFAGNFAAFCEFIHPHDRARMEAAQTSAVRSDGTQEVEYRIRRPDGEVRILHERGEVIFDQAGRPVRKLGMVMDVTENRRAEAKFRDSEERVRTTFIAAATGITIAEAGGRYLMVNPAYCRMLGRTEPALLAAKFEEFTHPEDLPRCQALIGDLVAGRQREGTLEKRYVRRDGAVIWVRASLSVVHASEGRSTRIITVTEDITRQKADAEKLQRSEALLHIAGRVARIGGWMIEWPERKLIWSDETCMIHDRPPGYSPTLEEGLAMFLPEDRERVNRLVEACARDGTPYDFEVPKVTATGRRIWVRSLGEAVRDAEGKIIRLQGAFQDITERKLAELELARTNRALRLLSACGDALIHAEEESQLLTEICRLAVEIGGYRMAWVGYAEEDAGRSIRPVAHAGVEAGYLSAIKLSWAEEAPAGRGPGARSIREGRPVICPDISADDTFFIWTGQARERGYRGVICLPLRHAGRTFGLLALYAGEVLVATAEEVKLLQEMADDLAFGIANVRARQERQRIHNTMLKVAANVSRSSSPEFYVQIAADMAEALGADAAFLACLDPDHPAMLRTIAAVVDGQRVDNFEYAVTHTPCEQLLVREECIITEKAAAQFPRAPQLQALGAQAYAGRRFVNSAGQATGLLFVLFRQPLKNPDFIAPILRIFATRAAAELERQESENRIREQASLLDKAQDAILVRDLNHRITYWNKSCERLYGWSAAEALGRTISHLIYRDAAPFEQATQRVLETGEWLGELRQISKDQRELTIEGRWTLVRDDQGRPKAVLAINTDITERKKLEAQFLRTQRMESIGTLAGGIAHDLNNVLAPIMMSVQMLETSVTADADRALLATLKNCTQRGADLVRQVLSFARGVNGERVPVNLRHIGNDICKIIQETFPKKLEFGMEFSRELWLVVGDPTQLHQVLMNLCVNARDAMPHGGRLTVKMENVRLDAAQTALNPGCPPGPYVMLSVTDTGMGIPAAIRDKIFEPFFTTKELGHGTGLGLSTVTAIVKSHGGFIHLCSEPGQGATFKVYVPAKAEDAAADLKKAPAQPSLPRGNNELILVVDDEESIRLVAQKTLNRFGYQVVTAANGAEALAIYARQQTEIALVLTDMAMPIMDGLALIVALKTMNPAVRIIASSGFTANDTVAEAREVGVRRFISKPFTAASMLKILHEALTESQ